eukprot:Sdes_comp10141_c0_seq2m1755
MAKSYSQFGLFTLNLLFWFFGAALVAVGIYSAHVGSLSSIQPYSVQWASVILGSSIFLISLLGCLGSCQESKFLLRLYFLILLFLLTAQCGVSFLLLPSLLSTSLYILPFIPLHNHFFSPACLACLPPKSQPPHYRSKRLGRVEHGSSQWDRKRTSMLWLLQS